MKDEYVTYALYSKSFDKIYVGFTSNLIARFLSHNKLGKGYTKKFRPWIVVYVEFFDCKKNALHREKELKSSRGRNFIRNIIDK
ncbi:MAG: GIY-YIG nuclease family protein [Flavobacteriaceae bacterium]|nr:GIY-YIG nuclease family protein [Flavobacteriaceae bacterium]